MPVPLHSPHLPAQREAERHRQLLFLLRGWPSVAVCFEACAGRRVRRLCPPAVALFCGLCACCHPLPAMPTALIKFLPPFSLLCPVHLLLFACPLFIPCAPGSLSAKPTCLQAARLSRWQLQHGPAVAARAPGPFDLFSFSCRVHDPGPWE